MKSLREILDRFDIYDIVEVVVDVLCLCVASPFIVRQFNNLTASMDYFWYVCVDLLTVVLFILAVDLLKKLLKVFVVWAERNS